MTLERRISFDVDETLVCRGVLGYIERGLLPRFIHMWLCEPLRARTRSLTRELKQRGWSVWVYTSSMRTPFQVRFWLFLHGITIDGVINDDRHRRELSVRRFSRLPSKYPPAFGIDLHVDDSRAYEWKGNTMVLKSSSWSQAIRSGLRKC
jgi:hypothetical protein